MIAGSILMGRAITGIRRTAGGKIRLDGVELVPDTARSSVDYRRTSVADKH
ncbi:MAG: hypothetical protein ACPG9U_08170 [Paracoccaceae bacterium]|jgi:hypothetical protein